MRLVHKIINRLRREFRHASAFLCARMFNTQPSEEDVLAAWQGRPASLDACMQEWSDGKPIVFADDTNPTAWNRDEILREADIVLQGRVQIFGEECDLTRPNRWHQDPLTRQAWPGDVHFTRYDVFHPAHDGVTDIRRLWELGRFGWAIPLARAYALTGDARYSDAWRNYVEDFIKKNPPEFGPHWLNAMEVALRAIQWSRALAIILNSPKKLHPSSLILHPSLLAHARYIRNHLEWTPYGRTNHYIADLVGLLTIATFVPQFRESKEWRHLASKQLIHEMDAQTDADGFHAEASTAYHHFVVELYTLVEHLDRQHHLDFPPRFHERLKQMRETDASLRGPENLDPQIGDDDSGTLQISNLKFEISDSPASESRSSALRVSDLKSLSRPGGDQISNSAEPSSRTSDLKSQISNLKSAALRSAGLYILRSDALSCHVACGPNGQEGVGGHAHNDKLSVVIRLRGRPMIIDAGTCCYSADIPTRNAFRSTAAHNTLMLDGKEQNPIEDWRMLRDRTHAHCDSWKDSETETTFCGEHQGYHHLGAIHRRSIQLDKKSHRLVILDEILGDGPHFMDFHLHLDPSLTRKNIRITPDRVTLPGAALIFPRAPAPTLLDTLCSPVYGQQVANLTIHFRCQINGHWKLPWEFHAIL